MTNSFNARHSKSILLNIPLPIFAGIIELFKNFLLYINNVNHSNTVYELAKDLRNHLDNIRRNSFASKLLNFDRDNLSNKILFNIIIAKLAKNSREQ